MRRGRGARPARRAEAARRALRRGPGVPRALPARGAGRGRAHAPEHRRHLRPLGVGRARRTSRWSWSTGRRSRSSCTERGPLPPDDRRRPDRADPAGARLRAQARDRAPRRQAAERDPRPRGPGQGRRLRDRPRRQLGDDRRRARSSAPSSTSRPSRPQGQPGRPPLGPLLDRRRALRAADRPRRRSTARRRSRSRSSTSTSARSRPASCAPGIPPALEAVVHALAGEGPGAALPERRGVHRRARAGAPRADAARS